MNLDDPSSAPKCSSLWSKPHRLTIMPRTHRHQVPIAMLRLRSQACVAALAGAAHPPPRHRLLLLSPSANRGGVARLHALPGRSTTAAAPSPAGGRRVAACLSFGQPPASAATPLLLQDRRRGYHGRRRARGGLGAAFEHHGVTEEDIVDVAFGAPHLWYPQARKLKRHIVCHVGPTNSGKTHEALERLRTARSGVYCGPLRLLAWEVYEKLNASGVPCNLLTGQELTDVPDARHTACTVEMADTSRVVDVAVVDEAQLIGDRERGSAWTRAILGIPAMELHLCGSPAFVSIVQELAKEMGDAVEVRRYDRLSPLKAMTKPVTSWAEIRPGDCVVAFSRRRLFRLKNEIELATRHRGLRCCVVYGALPPEARREQARLFNDASSGFDVLVASDAIGMGLNLNIARVLFEATEKFDGVEDRRLHPWEIKQIAGRAGRFQSRFEEGLVSARTRKDLARIAHALKAEDEPVRTAGVSPTREQLQQFARANGLRLRETEEDYALALEARRREARGKKGVRGAVTSLVSAAGGDEDGRTYVELSRLLQLFQRCAKLGASDSDLRERDGRSAEDLYFLCDMDDMVAIARLIEEIPISLRDRWTFCCAPADPGNKTLMAHVRYMALQYFRDGVVRLEVDMRSEKVPTTPQGLQHLEDLHAITDVYLWLGQRFGPDVFLDMEAAAAAAEECSDLIEEGLKRMRPKTASAEGRDRGFRCRGGGGRDGGRFRGRRGRR